MTDPLYHWQGRSLLMDTIVHRKRVIPVDGDRTQYCAFDVRRWVLPPEDELMGVAWQELSRRYRSYLQSISRSQLRDAKAKAVWHFVVEQIQYAREKELSDLWQFPPETLQLRRGDCEDKSFLCASLLLAAGIPEDCVRVVIGALRSGPAAHQIEGHAWPMYRAARGNWCILEPNLPHLPVRVSQSADATIYMPPRPVGPHKAIFLSADRLAADGARSQYVPLVCLTHRSVWTVEPLHSGQVQGGRGLEPDWSRNPTFDQILRWSRQADERG